MRTLCGLVLLSTLTALPAVAAPCGMHREAGAALPYAAGEELSYRMKFGGVSAGRAHLKLGSLERTPYGVGYPIRADLETNAYAAFATDLAGKFLSLLDPRSQQSRFYRSNLNESKGVISDRAIRNGGVIRFQHEKGKRRKAGILRGELIDPVQLIYGMRDLQFKEGQRVCLRMYAYSGLNRLRGRVVGRETIETAAGSIKTWRVDLFLKRGRKSYRVRMWVGEDKSRPLWRAELSHPKGILRVDLDRHVLGKQRIVRL